MTHTRSQENGLAVIDYASEAPEFLFLFDYLASKPLGVQYQNIWLPDKLPVVKYSRRSLTSLPLAPLGILNPLQNLIAVFGLHKIPVLCPVSFQSLSLFTCGFFI